MTQQKKKDYLILKLILGVVIGIVLGVSVNETWIQIILTVKQILSQVIFYMVPLIIVGFITPSIAGLKENANKMLFTALAIAYLSSVGAALMSMFAGYAIIPSLNIVTETEGLKALPDLLFHLEIPALFPVMTAPFTAEIMEEAAIKVVAGPEKRSKVVVERERVLTAYHEAGHAIVSTVLPNMDTVHMITIVPRGRAGGFTAFLPEEDVSYMTKKGMENELVSFLGGRAAEELILGDISTGASNDIERATRLARAMVTKYGMSERLGTIAYGSEDEEVFLGNQITHSRNYSEEVASVIDEEIKIIMDTAYQTAMKLLSEYENVLHALAGALLERETLREEEYKALFAEYRNGKEAKIPEELARALEYNRNREDTLGIDKIEDEVRASEAFSEKEHDEYERVEAKEQAQDEETKNPSDEA